MWSNRSEKAYSRPSSTSRTVGALIAVGALTLAAGCGSGSGGELAATGPAVAAGEQEWNDILDAADGEGQVSLYYSLAGMEAVVDDFKAANAGIEVNLTFGATGDLTTRLDQEMGANVQGADVVFHASPGWFSDKSDSDALAALQVSPQEQQEGWEKLLDGNSYAEVFGFPYTIGYRTSESAPTDLKELLDQNPGASIGLVDPHASPASANVYQTLVDAYGDGILDQLANANFKIEANNSSLAQSFASGAFDYAYPSQSSTTRPLIDKGAPIAESVTETAVAGAYYNAAILRNAAHPNASQVFVNWLMSTAGAESFVKHVGPATVPLNVAGSVPWGEVKAYDPSDWTTEKWNSWIATQWTPRFQR